MAQKRSPKNSGLSEPNLGADYTADEVEFFNAVEAYKKRTGKRFPTNKDLLDIAKSLGYRKVK